MATLGQSSFRRTLLSCILLLSVPVLILGEVVTYKKARSSLLETARQNLTESAVRKGENIQELIRALQSNLITASETETLRSGALSQTEAYLGQLQRRLPMQTQCIQLTSLETGEILASTCGKRISIVSVETLRSSKGFEPARKTSDSPFIVNSWPQQRNQLVSNHSLVHVTPAGQPGPTTPSEGQLSLVLSVPVYGPQDRLRYALSVQTALHQRESGQPGSLAGYTVVIDQDGTILAHPNSNRVGRNIKQEPDASRLQHILKNAVLAGDSDVRHLFGFEDDGTEWLAGYSPITVPITTQEDHTWVVLAVTRLDNALYGLEEIKQILFILTFGLITANLLATLYVARDLSLPLEQLGNYALRIQRRHTAPESSYSHRNSSNREANSTEAQIAHSKPRTGNALVALDITERAPKNFRIRELNQLSKALNSMVERLEERAEELEAAWREAEAANRLKSEFLANTSHELRTPLNAIIGCIRLVRDGCCDDREEEIDFLQRADDAAIHLLDVINDLLDIAKIEAGSLAMDMKPVDLCAVVQEVVDLQRVSVEQKGLQLKLSGLAAPIMVQADQAKLRQVLLNVMGNAVKFTDQGSIAIATQVVPAAETPNGAGNPQVKVMIQDTGIGIDPSQQHKLFRPFVMVDGTTTRRYEGTGLGLAISRNFVNLMGGEVSLYSAGIDQGTTVTIELPLINSSPLNSSVSDYPDSSPAKNKPESVAAEALNEPASDGLESGLSSGSYSHT